MNEKVLLTAPVLLALAVPDASAANPTIGATNAATPRFVMIRIIPAPLSWRRHASTERPTPSRMLTRGRLDIGRVLHRTGEAQPTKLSWNLTNRHVNAVCHFRVTATKAPFT